MFFILLLNSPIFSQLLIVLHSLKLTGVFTHSDWQECRLRAKQAFDSETALEMLRSWALIFSNQRKLWRYRTSASPNFNVCICSAEIRSLQARMSSAVAATQFGVAVQVLAAGFDKKSSYSLTFELLTRIFWISSKGCLCTFVTCCPFAVCTFGANLIWLVRLFRRCTVPVFVVTRCLLCRLEMFTLPSLEA